MMCDIQILKTAHVVGLTTTAAARLRPLLCSLSPSIGYTFIYVLICKSGAFEKKKVLEFTSSSFLLNKIIFINHLNERRSNALNAKNK